MTPIIAGQTWVRKDRKDVTYLSRATVRVRRVDTTSDLGRVEVEYLTDEETRTRVFKAGGLVTHSTGGMRSQVGRRVTMLARTLRAGYRLKVKP